MKSFSSGCVLSGIFLLVFAAAAYATPVADWEFDEASGTAVLDSTGNGLNLNLYGVPVWTTGHVIGSHPASSSQLCIDLHPDRFGWMSNCWYQGDLTDGGYPVIARSFSEWLERTLDHGADASGFYWEEPDFIDLGPAILNDPYYRPIGRVP